MPEKIYSKKFGYFSDWIDLSSGNYNHVSKSPYEISIKGYICHWVMKSAKNKKEGLSTPARAVRKWEKINPEYPAYLIADDDENIVAWIVPFLGNTPATDIDIAHKVLEIYVNTRNIVFDATSRNNFLLHNGKAVCVDIDLSLHFNRGSFESDEIMKEIEGLPENEFNLFLHNSSRIMPITTSWIKNLIFLEKCLAPNTWSDPNEIPNQFLIPETMGIIESICKAKRPITDHDVQSILQALGVYLEPMPPDDDILLANKVLTIYQEKAIIIEDLTREFDLFSRKLNAPKTIEMIDNLYYIDRRIGHEAIKDELFKPGFMTEITAERQREIEELDQNEPSTKITEKNPANKRPDFFNHHQPNHQPNHHQKERAKKLPWR